HPESLATNCALSGSASRSDVATGDRLAVRGGDLVGRGVAAHHALLVLADKLRDRAAVVLELHADARVTAREPHIGARRRDFIRYHARRTSAAKIGIAYLRTIAVTMPSNPMTMTIRTHAANMTNR